MILPIELPTFLRDSIAPEVVGRDAVACSM